MKKFKFTLEKVLNVKNQFHEVKRAELLQLRIQLRKVLEAIDENNATFDRYNSEMNDLMEKGTSVENIERYKSYFKVLINEEKRLKTEGENINRAIAAKQQEILEIKTEISGLEKLKEKQQADYDKEMQKEQEREIEEFLNEKLSGAETTLDI